MARQLVPGADIAHHLARHGVKVEVERIASTEADIASTILSHAADASADLLVMGGYGHSRMREFILGGVTRGILASMTVPTLMSQLTSACCCLRTRHSVRVPETILLRSVTIK